MTLESIDSFFKAGGHNETLRKALLAQKLGTEIEALLGEGVRVILRRNVAVIECQNEAAAARLNLRRRRLLTLMDSVFGGAVPKVRITISR